MREARKMFFVWGRRNSHHSLLGIDGGAIHYRTKDMLNQRATEKRGNCLNSIFAEGHHKRVSDMQTDLPFIVGGVLFIHILIGARIDNENNNNFM